MLLVELTDRAREPLAQFLPRVHRAAHSLKGMLDTLGGRASAAEAGRLEQAARAGDADRARETRAAVEEAVARFRAELELLDEGERGA